MSRSARDAPLECKIYVGDLPKDASEKDLERAFSYYGPLRNVWIARNPPGFAFIEFEDSRDAEDSVRGLDGSNICGVRVRVENSSGKIRPKPWMRHSDRGGRRMSGNDRCYECGDIGHYAKDCSRNRRGAYGGRRRSRSRSYERRRRSYSRSRSRGRDRNRSASRSPRKHSRSRSRSISPRRSPRSDN